MTDIKNIFDEQGFVGPVQFLTPTDVNYYLAKMQETVDTYDLMESDYRCKANVLFPWINELSKHPIIVEHVREILGENFSCWDTLVWNKKKESKEYVSWHQDATYWNFLPKERGLTVWVTLSGATKDMGCIQYIPGSHKKGQSKHHDVKAEGNLLMRGQTLDLPKPKNTHYAEAKAGSFIMHSPFIFHGSDNNKTSTPRVALGLIYAATDAKPHATHSPESTILVSGEDTYNYMIHDPEPTGEFQYDVINWRKAYDRQHDNYYKISQLV
jgi:ectoine hydroxylase-related dioxygenase (phytanoyl-CoA dioxygenase family)